MTTDILGFPFILSSMSCWILLLSDFRTVANLRAQSLRFKKFILNLSILNLSVSNPLDRVAVTELSSKILSLPYHQGKSQVKEHIKYPWTRTMGRGRGLNVGRGWTCQGTAMKEK